MPCGIHTDGVTGGEIPVTMATPDQKKRGGPAILFRTVFRETVPFRTKG